MINMQHSSPPKTVGDDRRDNILSPFKKNTPPSFMCLSVGAFLNSLIINNGHKLNELHHKSRKVSYEVTSLRGKCKMKPPQSDKVGCPRLSTVSLTCHCFCAIRPFHITATVQDSSAVLARAYTLFTHSPSPQVWKETILCSRLMFMVND